ncbi:MAG TPA: hypothetical protein VGK17_01225 [Propionicimonas sp.]
MSACLALVPATGAAGSAEPGPSNVAVAIPPGALTLTAPRYPTSERGRPTVSVVVTDTRAGDPGFTLTVDITSAVTVPSRADDGSEGGVGDVRVVQVPGNAMRATDFQVAVRGHSGAQVVYPAGLSRGSATLVATLGRRAGSAPAAHLVTISVM